MKKFERIYVDLKSKIQNGTFPTNSFLPKEEDLSKEYKVARGTLRKALDNLEDQGYVKKIHGSGSKVLNSKKIEIPTNSITNFTNLKNHKEDSLITNVLKNKLEYLQSDNFGFDDAGNQAVISIERIRILNNRRVVLDRDKFLVIEVGDSIPYDCLNKSVYNYLEEVKGLKIGYAQKIFTIEEVNPSIRLLLDVDDDSHVAVTRSLVYTKNARLFQIHESFQCVSTFYLSDIAKR